MLHYTRLDLMSQEAQHYAEENAIIHMETSAKDASNVKALFREIGG